MSALGRHGPACLVSGGPCTCTGQQCAQMIQVREDNLDHSCCFPKISAVRLFICEVRGIEPRAQYMGSKHSPTNHALQSGLFPFPDKRQHFSFERRLVLNSEFMKIDTFKLPPRTTWLVPGLSCSWADHGFQNILPSLGPHQGLLVLQLSEEATHLWVEGCCRGRTVPYVLSSSSDTQTDGLV